MNIGKTLKKMRELRNVTQRQLCEGISSQAALSRMEASGNIPSKMLLAFLARLDIQPIEFFALVEENQLANTRVFLDKLINAKYSRQKTDILIQQEMDLYEKTGILRHKINALCVNASYYKANDILFKNKILIAKEVKQYLLELGAWFINDVLLYVNVLFLFDNEFIRSNHLKVINLLSQSPFNATQKYTYQVNYANEVILLAFERKNLFDLNFYLANYQKLLINDFNSLSPKICYSIFKQLYQLMINFNSKNYQYLLEELKNIDSYVNGNMVLKLIDLVDECLRTKLKK
ncbi:MAG: helix-turn-helix domain-containing protein [Bombilactobacillus mellifer]|nr:helix-turn-helix domain-containing protein [Bombilactobacillus mellifer]